MLTILSLNTRVLFVRLMTADVRYLKEKRLKWPVPLKQMVRPTAAAAKPPGPSDVGSPPVASPTAKASASSTWMVESVGSSEEAADVIVKQAETSKDGLQDGMFIVWPKGKSFVLSVVYKNKVRLQFTLLFIL